MELLEAVGDFPVWKPMIVPRKRRLSNDVHPELPLIGAVGVGGDSFRPAGVALVAVAVVLCCLWWLWIGNLLDESGADARRLVEVITALRAAVTGNLDFPVWLRRRPPLWVVSLFTAGSPTVSPDIVVIIVLRGRGLVGPRPSLAGWRMWILVLPEARFEFFDPFLLFLDPLVFPVKLLFQLVNSLLHLEKA